MVVDVSVMPDGAEGYAISNVLLTCGVGNCFAVGYKASASRLSCNLHGRGSGGLRPGPDFDAAEPLVSQSIWLLGKKIAPSGVGVKRGIDASIRPGRDGI